MSDGARFTSNGGYLEVGTSGSGEVVINHLHLDVDADGVGHIVFSPKEARALANLLNRKSVEANEERKTKGLAPQ